MDKYRGFRLSFAIIIILLISQVSSAAILCMDGIPNATIIINSEPSLTERLAATELKHYIQKISGADLKVIEKDCVPREEVEDFIAIGTLTHSKIREAGITIDEGYLIKATADAVYLTGATDRDALYAVYAFLEEVLEVKWIWPGEAGEVVPKSRDIVIPEFIKADKPALPLRGYHLCNNHTHDEAEKWMSRNRLNYISTPPGSPKAIFDRRRQRGFEIVVSSHSMNRFFPPTLFNDYPEYFAKINGVPIEGGQPDYTHPEVKRMTVEAILKELERDPNISVLGVIPYDHTRFGESPEDPPDEAAKGVVSTRVYKFVNDVALEVNKKYPDCRIMSLSYSSYTQAPKVKPANENMLVQFAMFKCYNHDINCERNQVFIDNLSNWHNLGYKTTAYHYYLGVTRGVPIPLAYVIADDIKFSKEFGMEGWRSEVSPPGAGPEASAIDWENNKWTYYVGAKLMWDSDLDYREVLEEGFSAYYGPAADEMLKLYYYMEDVWKSYPTHIGWQSSTNGLVKEFTSINPNFIPNINKYLANASFMVEGLPGFKERVSREAELYKSWEEAYLNIREWKLKVPKTTKKPKIDGRFDEEEWKDAAIISGFVTSDGKFTSDNTKAFLSYDNDALYIAFELHDSNIEEIRANETEHDKNVWSDDCVEIFIDPNYTRDTYFHLIMNSLGTKYDALCSIGKFDREWNGFWEGASSVDIDEQRWIAEIKIPFSTLGKTPKAGERWLINLAREQKTQGNVVSTWTNGVFHDPQSFGILIFD